MLVRIQQKTRDLGCLAETDGQQTGCERIQTARVAGLARGIQLLDGLQRGIRCKPRGLVQQQDAVHTTEVTVSMSPAHKSPETFSCPAVDHQGTKPDQRPDPGAVIPPARG